jgi:hypothetical protein
MGMVSARVDGEGPTVNQGEALGERAVPVAAEAILLAIHDLRGQRVMLDTDLAALYGVETKALNQAVKRNIARFPSDFMFRLTAEEAAASRSQSVTLKSAPEASHQSNVQRATPRGANVKYVRNVEKVNRSTLGN